MSLFKIIVPTSSSPLRFTEFVFIFVLISEHGNWAFGSNKRGTEVFLIHSNVTRIFKSFFFFFLVRAPRPPRRRKCRGDFFFSCVGTLATPAANLHRQLVRQLVYNVFVIYFMYHFTCGKLNDMKILKCFIILCPRL